LVQQGLDQSQRSGIDHVGSCGTTMPGESGHRAPTPKAREDPRGARTKWHNHPTEAVKSKPDRPRKNEIP
jgi:hypothetical protein